MSTRSKWTGWIVASALAGGAAMAQGVPAEAIHLVVMGGPDCPFCEGWRRFDLPKLRSSEAFRGVRYTPVMKAIGAAVPPAALLPDDVKPMKAQLDDALGHASGSPLMVLLVDGKVHDVWRGVRNAPTLESAIEALRRGEPSPVDRCLRLSRHGVCVQRPD